MYHTFKIKLHICLLRNILDKLDNLLSLSSQIDPAHFQQKGIILLIASRWILNVSLILSTTNSCLAWTAVSQFSYLGTLVSPGSVKSGVVYK